MNEIQSLIIGAIQGITEFLPISSSAHLVLVPYIFGWNYQGLSFDVALHFGTVLAILAFFWKDWVMLIAQAISKSKIQTSKSLPTGQADEANSNDQNSNLPNNLLWQILIASIPAAIIGYFLSDIVETALHSPLLLAINLIVFGIILWLIDKYSSSKYKIQNTRYKQSFVIGCSQAIALIPGVSRSGITMTASRLMGIERKDAAKISFLIGTPAMIGAFLFTAKDMSLSDLNATFLSAVMASTIFGFIAIKYLLKYLERGNFAVFSWYRIVLAVLIISLYFLR